ncbi:hypothetical protein B0J14DRAFT_605882 [Halenospora varia]|nr:hypothetical protein B0J14DRAFT_605882 [Halenospora varia]
METDILTELYATLDSEPKNIHVLEILLELWIDQGDEVMAGGIASEILLIDPTNRAAKRHSRNNRDRRSERGSSQRTKLNEKPAAPSRAWSDIKRELEEGYTGLKKEAELLREEIAAVQLFGGHVSDSQQAISDLQNITEGRVSTVISVTQPVSVREVVRAVMKLQPRQASWTRKAQEMIIEDFVAIVTWATSQSPPQEVDDIRERLMKRKELMEAALPETLSDIPAIALTQIEREHLQKQYINTETMLGDRIEDIPKQNFFVSEDNYAFDMEELIQALIANDGVMRNPLSRVIFSESEIRKILAHPSSERLRPIQLAQSQLRKGIRSATIERVAKLGEIMLADQSPDARNCRDAVEEFLAYVVTLPKKEQETINSLKIPGKDKFSQQAFDYTIGESVRDAKANTTCFHKVGDFLTQAAAYLRKQKA